MKTEIKYNQVSKSDDLEQYIEKRIHFSFSRFSGKVLSIHIHLRDLNGPKGGWDKKCIAKIRMKSQTFCVEATENNLYKAVDAALDRLQRKMLRQFDRAKRRNFFKLDFTQAY